MKKIISLIVSVYNEEKGLNRFYEVTREIVRQYVSHSAGNTLFDYEFCFVDDGSTDKSAGILASLKSGDPRHISVISLSRNFGHEAAMTAGLDYAQGDYLIFMDADLQHPPTLIPKIMETFASGAEVISMVRIKNESTDVIKKITSGVFYNLINSVSNVSLIPGASDFFALDKKAAEVLRKNYREKVRFLRGYVQNIGFKCEIIEYEAGKRIAGKSHYGIKKLLSLSLDALICFSDMPLKLGIYAGLVCGALGIVLIIYTLLTRRGAPSGYATIVIVLCFMFAVLFLLVGIIGMYLARLFRESQDRPIYILKNADKAKMDRM